MTAVDNTGSKRSYTSPLRERLAQETRELIFRGAAKVLEDEAHDELSYAAVAQAAGVAERTVYRHFPTKDQLLDAVWQWTREQMGFGRYPADPRELLAMLPEVYRGFDRHARLMQGYLFSQAGRRLQQRYAARRRKSLRACLAEATAGLTAADRRNAEAVIQLLYSGRGWSALRDNWGLSGEEAAQAAAWAVQVLLREVRVLQQSAQPEGEG